MGTREKSVPSGGNGECKGPAADTRLACLRKRKGVSVAGVEQRDLNAFQSPLQEARTSPGLSANPSLTLWLEQQEEGTVPGCHKEPGTVLRALHLLAISPVGRDSSTLHIQIRKLGTEWLSSSPEVTQLVSSTVPETVLNLYIIHASRNASLTPIEPPQSRSFGLKSLLHH